MGEQGAAADADHGQRAPGPSLGGRERQWRVARRRLRHYLVGKLGGVCRLQCLAVEELELGTDAGWLREGVWNVRQMTSFAAT